MLRNGRTMKEEDSAIDLFRVIFAVCVVAIHSSMLLKRNMNNIIAWYVMHLICRMAVPFFFVVSGYFFGKSYIPAYDKREKIYHYVRKNLPYVIFWGIFVGGGYTGY